ncbi:uncharacterized protein LOC108511531 [Phoenix dactylifera]|uniref:Uncharacterized protein LOC108511531 n=1 Tax=Phoenix dactylifera TaxID=42345 RepID=A0A8B7MVB4_PHODC|nr:uncharacterized protein LOC108511531 [Phoenix dactylifera]
MVDTEAVEGLRVCDLLTPGGAEWDEARLRQLFGVHLAERIRSLPLPGCAGPDVRVWGTSNRASVRLEDLSRVIQPEHEPGPDCTWIWRFGLHPRAALFLWKVFWDCLPTRAVLSRHGWGILAKCGTCGAEESVDHVFFQCTWARSTRQWTWIPQEARSEATIPSGDTIVVGQFADLSEGHQSDLHSISDLADKKRSYFWRAQGVTEVGCGVCSSIGHGDRAHPSLDRPLTAWDTWVFLSAPTAPQTVFFTCEPPPSSFLKVNFDGLVLDGSTLGGANFVIRGPHSKMVAAGGCQLFDTSVPEAEL